MGPGGNEGPLLFEPRAGAPLHPHVHVVSDIGNIPTPLSQLGFPEGFLEVSPMSFEKTRHLPRQDVTEAAELAGLLLLDDREVRLIEALRGMDLDWPEPDYDVDEQRARLAQESTAG